jgi:hypothetical protein
MIVALGLCKILGRQGQCKADASGSTTFPLFSTTTNLAFQIFPKLFAGRLGEIKGLRVEKFENLEKRGGERLAPRRREGRGF